MGIFEAALQAENLALVRQGDLYTIVPIASARKQPHLVAGSSGYGTEAVQLRFVNPVSLKKLLDPMVPQGSIAQADAGRNILMITGTGAERAQVRSLIRQFDVNWMHGMSFALFVPKNTDSKSLAAELDAMINAPGTPSASVVRLISLQRLNAVLAISADPAYLAEIKKWVAVLDRAGAEGERRLYVYRVQNGRATDLAKSISTAFGGTGGGGANTPANAISAANQNRNSATATANPLVNPLMPQMQSQNGTGDDDSSTTDALPGAPQSISQTVTIGSPDNPVTISSDETNNAILVYGTARQFAIVQDALTKLDILPLQVMIDATIAEVTLNDELQYGVQWFFSGSGNQVALSQGKTSTPTQIFPGFSYFVSNKSNSIQASLNALSTVTTVKVISAPKVLVLNNRTASLQVGDQVPIVTQSSVSTDTSGAPVINSVEYRDTGVILKVTPRVNDSGLVLLDVSQEVSDVAQTASSNIDSPTIQQRKIASSIAIRDGQTIALGGLIRDNTTLGKDGIPVLSKIPVLGALFGNTDNTKKRTELLVMITPRVVRTDLDAVSVTQELQDKLQSLQPILVPGKAK
jgi:general secretion pathway protein D